MQQIGDDYLYLYQIDDNYIALKVNGQLTNVRAQ